MAVDDPPLIEGPAADRWRALSEEVQRARHAGRPTGPNEALLAQAKQEGDGDLAPALVLWAADSLLAEARFDEAIRLYGQVPDHQPSVKELDVRGEALKATAEAFEALGDADAAMEAHERLAGSGLPGSSPARAFYEQGRIAAEARRDDEARKAFARAGDVKEEPGAAEVPYADLAKRAVARLEAGAGRRPAERRGPRARARDRAAATRRPGPARPRLPDPLRGRARRALPLRRPGRRCWTAWSRTSRPPRCASTRAP